VNEKDCRIVVDVQISHTTTKYLIYESKSLFWCTWSSTVVENRRNNGRSGAMPEIADPANRFRHSLPVYFSRTQREESTASS
jgi:hypothetical protein